MHLGEDSRAADAGVWRRRPGPLRRGFRREPPLLAVEVSGRDDTRDALREKARWYLAAGVPVIWIALPDERRVGVVTPAGESSHGMDERPCPAGARWRSERLAHEPRVHRRSTAGIVLHAGRPPALVGPPVAWYTRIAYGP